jgi:ribonuclease Z
MSLGRLRGDVATISPGARIAYVVDAAPTDANLARIEELAQGASNLFIETAFLDEDADRARDRRHLTAKLAGEVAARAGVQNFATLHYSPRYEDRADDLRSEAETAFWKTRGQ